MLARLVRRARPLARVLPVQRLVCRPASSGPLGDAAVPNPNPNPNPNGDTEHAAVQLASSGVYSPPDAHALIGDLQRQMRDLYREGRYGDARDAGLECHTLARDSFGTDHPATASVANNLALMHKSLGEMDE